MTLLRDPAVTRAAAVTVLIVTVVLSAPYVSALCSDYDGDCTMCVADPTCGYCNDGNTCVDGAPGGPTSASCVDWDYGYCGDCGSHDGCKECFVEPGSGPCADCDVSRPVQCPTGICMFAPDECPTINSCSTATDFMCRNGTCGESPQVCVGNCVSVSRTCSDGSCVDSMDDCPPLRACPSSYRQMCGDGSCVLSSVTESCPAVPDCQNPGSETRCDDGICRPLADKCPRSNRCPLFKPHLCGNGKCVKDAEECLQGCSSQDFHRCRSGGSCFLLGFSCTLPHRLVKILPTSTTLSTASAMSVIKMYSDDSPSEFQASVTIPAAAWQTGGTVIVDSEAVAESDLREIAGNSAWSGVGDGTYEDNIFSTVVQLRWPAEVTWDAEPIEVTFEVDEDTGFDLSPSDLCLAQVDELSLTWECIDGALASSRTPDQSGIRLTGYVKDPSRPMCIMTSDVFPLIYLILLIAGVTSLVVLALAVHYNVSKRRLAAAERQRRRPRQLVGETHEAVLQLRAGGSRGSRGSGGRSSKSKGSAGSRGGKKKKEEVLDLKNPVYADAANYQSVSIALGPEIAENTYEIRDTDPFASTYKKDGKSSGKDGKGSGGKRKHRSKSKDKAGRKESDKHSKSAEDKHSGGKRARRKKSSNPSAPQAVPDRAPDAPLGSFGEETVSAAKKERVFNTADYGTTGEGFDPLSATSGAMYAKLLDRSEADAAEMERKRLAAERDEERQRQEAERKLMEEAKSGSHLVPDLPGKGNVPLRDEDAGGQKIKKRIVFDDESKGTTRSKRQPPTSTAKKMKSKPKLKHRDNEASDLKAVKLPRQKMPTGAAKDDQFVPSSDSSYETSSESD